METSYKEKYEQALAKAKEQYNYPCMRSCMGILEEIFPELAESEDEMVSKRISQSLHGYLLNSDEIIQADAWLKKQAEHANFLSKIQVGDKVTRNEAGVLVNISQLNRVAKPEENNGNLGGISANWSEEDSFRTETLISVIKSGGSIRPELRNEYINWLKSLRPQNTYNPYKAVVESIAEMCKHYDKASHSGLRDFYDNVKVKSKEAQEYDKMFPQAQWKPTDEQMGCLSDAIEHYNSLGYPASKLKELLDDLKKLKECV